jgi:hypothetical protein
MIPRFQRSLGTLFSFTLLLGMPSAFADEAPPTIAPATTSAAETTSSASVAQDPNPSPPSLAPPAAKPLRLDGPDGTYIRLGILLQPQLQAMNSPTLDGYAKNLYIRRTRILLGGSLIGKVDFFLDTDYPNLFLSSNTAAAGAPNNYVKNTPGMNIQDAFVTYKPMGELVKVDAGYMLPPLGHNALQGATTLYGLDYFSYSFQHSNAFGTSSNPIGRDLGVQLRGLVLDGRLEYRLGLFQGLRLNRTTTEMEARNFFRVAGRVQVNLLEAETAFFYQGTYLGTKRVASLGASYDFQDNYKYFAVDGFVDLPLGPGLVTGQVTLPTGMAARPFPPSPSRQRSWARRATPSRDSASTPSCASSAYGTPGPCLIKHALAVALPSGPTVTTPTSRPSMPT